MKSWEAFNHYDSWQVSWTYENRGYVLLWKPSKNIKIMWLEFRVYDLMPVTLKLTRRIKTDSGYYEG